jgi:hypothetical protein
MSEAEKSDLAKMLESGWAVVGYSVCLMAAGATSHHILLQQGSNVTTFVVILSSGEELGREAVPLSPPMPKKKGWFG